MSGGLASVERRLATELLPSILVIEDDSAHAELIERALEPLRPRYRVRIARSLREGRLAIAAETPLLALADMHLSDGRALELLPGPHERASFPILVLTSHGDERTAVQSIRAGALDYVVKSSESFTELPRTVERALREWRAVEDQLRAERALRESEERFRVLFSAAPDALLIHELDGRVLDANRAAEELFGLPRKELLSRRLDQLGFGGVDLAAHSRRSDAQRASRATGPELLFVEPAPNMRRDVELRTVPLKLSSHAAVLATVQDVSTRLSAERARQRLEEQLHHALKLEAMGRLAGGVAHDFNNLLTAIAGYSELMLGGGLDPQEWSSSLREILNAAHRATALTAQLLAFSRKQLIEPVVLDLNDLLSNATRMLQRLIGEDVELSFEPGAPLHRVKIDPNQLEQVLINLAVNARDAMPQGGALRVSTRNVEIGEREHRQFIDAVPGQYALLCVEDSGTGMNDETLSRLFEPFFTTKERGRGTGLGLSIIYGVVKQNGGFILVHSRIGHGTRFEIYLPRAVDEDSSMPESHEPRVAPRGHETILLVEDEPAVREVMARFLRNAGYGVVAVSRGSEAIELLTHDGLHVDLLVSDVVLPAMDGKQLFERLSAMRPQLQVLFVSGYTDDVIAKHGVLDRGVAFLEKPLSQEKLVRAVRAVLDRSASGL